jgi:Microtubule binding
VQDEVIMRKKIYNMMEDMKGKIRVFARVRPILTFEREKGQQLALKVMDELTLAHDWKSQKREYSFDAVYDPQASQEKVYLLVLLLHVLQ